MKKLLTLSLMTFLFITLFLAGVSAYAYGGCVGCSYGGRPYDDNYDSVSYHRVNSNAYNTRYTDYDRSSDSGWYGGDYVKRTTIIRTVRDSPRYYNDYDPGRTRPVSYYRGYDNNPYWYQKYWENDRAYYGNPNIRYGNARYYNY